MYAGAKDVERVAECIGQDMQRWVKREREQVLLQEQPVGSEKTIPILYVCYDGTGVPMTRKELAGRKGKQADGTAKTREVKLGCVFTQTTTDQKGFPIRDPESTSFVGAIESSEEFGWRIYGEAVRRGLYRGYITPNGSSSWAMAHRGSEPSLNFTSQAPRRSLISIMHDNTSLTCARFFSVPMKSK